MEPKAFEITISASGKDYILTDPVLSERLVEVRSFLSSHPGHEYYFLDKPIYVDSLGTAIDPMIVGARFENFSIPLQGGNKIEEELPTTETYCWGFCGPNQVVDSVETYENITGANCNFMPFDVESAAISEDNYTAGRNSWFITANVGGQQRKYEIRSTRFKNIFEQINTTDRTLRRTALRLKTKVAKKLVLGKFLLSELKNVNTAIFMPLIEPMDFPLYEYDKLDAADKLGSIEYSNVVDQAGYYEATRTFNIEDVIKIFELMTVNGKVPPLVTVRFFRE